MKQLILILSLMSLVSCGIRQEKVKKLSIHPELQGYFKEFESYYGQKIDDLEMTFAPDIYNPKPGTVTMGYCMLGTTYKNQLDKTLVYSTPKIVINRKQWESTQYPVGIKGNLTKRTQLIFHEMGHCILKRDHDASQASIMYKELNVQIASANLTNKENPLIPIDSSNPWVYWLRELFSKSNLIVKANYETIFSGMTHEVESFEVAMEDAEEMTEPLVVPNDDCVHDKGVEVENEESQEHSHEHHEEE